MKNRRDILIICGLFGTLILFVAIGPRLRPQQPDASVPTTYGSGETGALALYRWAGNIGYEAERLEYRAFDLAEEDAALVILNPTEEIDQDEALMVLDWVENGGTLILADDESIAFGAPNALFDELDVRRDVYSDTATIDRADPAQPALDQPPVGTVQTNTGRVLVPQTSDYVKLVGTDDANIVIGLKRGSGYVYLSSATFPFTNAGLRDEANAALVLNMLRRVPAGGRVLFDEIHHGYFTPPSTTRLVLASPWGLAAAYATVALALYLALGGRRFGRPVPLREEVARRSSAEYVESMADLFQRGGKRSYILRHYHAAFKRRLAKSSGTNPQLPDHEFVRELARFRDLDEAALLALLARLRNERASEEELVRAISDVEAFAHSAKF